jgi:hypothetical protein
MVFTLQTLPACDEPFGEGAGKVAELPLHAGVAARADECKKLERLCRCVSRPAAAEKRLSLTPNGNVRYDVKGFTSVAGAGMRRSDPAKDALPRRHDRRHPKAARFLCPAGGGAGSQAAGQPSPTPLLICNEQQTPRSGVVENFERPLRNAWDFIPLCWI